MALPVSVVCDRGGAGPLDLTPRIAEGSLDWSSVVPGGFASCSFQIDGDFRRTLKDIPYLSTIRIVGDSGTILWEGQVEDLSPTLSEDSVGLKVTAMGWQNVLKETTVRAAWMVRDLGSINTPPPHAYQPSGGLTAALALTTGNFDASNLGRAGLQVAGVGGVAAPLNSGQTATLQLPIGITPLKLLASATKAGSTNLTAFITGIDKTGAVSPTDYANTAAISHSQITATLKANTVLILLGALAGAAYTPATGDVVTFENIRILCTSLAADVADVDDGSGNITYGGYYGDTLIKNLLSSYVTELGQGVIESGSDFAIDHLDASVRRTAYEILQEIAAYYSREWAVWEGALLDWRTPNLTQPQWVIPITALSGLDLDASVTNSQKTAVVLYTDAASQLSAEQSSVSADRRNPYVLNGRVKDELVSMGTMTSNTAQQLATILLNDLGFGPVPAAGTITLPGDTLIQHASGNAVKAWEIRAGQNVTIPELPVADIFTQDGRGEVLFHIVSTEASTAKGEVTLTLDSYGSKRSDVLMARIAAVTKLLGG